MSVDHGPGRARIVAFVLIALGAVATAAVTVLRAARRAPSREAAAVNERPSAAPNGSLAAPSSSDGAPTSLGALLGAPRVLFRNVDGAQQSAAFGRLAVAPLRAAADGLAPAALFPGARRTLPLACARVHFASGHGLCVEVPDAQPRALRVHLLDASLNVGWTSRLDGLASRVRVSPDGRRGAVTVFVTGHSYSDGEYSTQTTLYDLEAHASLGDLEAFAVERDGKPVKASDRNFWGVTFARDPDRFYATHGTKKTTWLAVGSVREKKLRLLHENVECPSLSPDGTRLAYKKRVAGPGEWRLQLLELATLTERALEGETRSVDDQLEWLDDTRVLYKLGPDVLVLAVDGATPPRVWLTHAASPAVVRE